MAAMSSSVAEGTALRREGRKDRDEKKAEPSDGNHKYLSVDSGDSGGRAPSARC